MSLVMPPRILSQIEVERRMVFSLMTSYHNQVQPPKDYGGSNPMDTHKPYKLHIIGMKLKGCKSRKDYILTY